MYRCMTELKALVIDIDSFEKIDEDAVNNLAWDYQCLFLTSDEEKKNQLVSQFGEDAVYFMNKFLRAFAPSQITHGIVLNLLKVKTTEIAYVSCDIDFLRHALTFCSGTIWITNRITYEEVSTSPDLIMPDLAELVDCLEHDRGGFLGENIIENKENASGFMVQVNFLSDRKKTTLFTLGRYYAQTHYMKQKHQYSAAIYHNKKSGGKCYGIYEDDFLTLYRLAISKIAEHIEIDGICAVPPHQGEKSRFDYIIK